jgi:hypothetical protein
VGDGLRPVQSGPLVFWNTSRREAYPYDAATGLLRIIGFALDGSRDAMTLLEEVFADLVRAYPDPFCEPPEP